MNKDFNEKKLLSMTVEKQFKVLYDLASFIEKEQYQLDSNHFKKLIKYHSFLAVSEDTQIKKINKEFHKIKALDHQFQIYLMNLERLLGQSKKEYQFMVETGDKSHSQAIVKRKIICFLDSIRSAHNIGAIFRTSECFGVERIILSGYCPLPESTHVQKTAMGCDKLVSYEVTTKPIEKINELKSTGYKIIAVETAHSAITPEELQPIDKCVLIFGHEQYGISHELLKACDFALKIPLIGQKNSLNVSISHGITLSEISKKITDKKS